VKIRRACEDDIPQMTELTDERRRLYEAYEPTFWRRAPNARPAQAAFFKTLISNRNAIVLVCEDVGVFCAFVIASLIEAPTVYAPGGKICMIDDFAVIHHDWQEAGRALLSEARPSTPAYA
jgi:hypothetical protein